MKKLLSYITLGVSFFLIGAIAMIVDNAVSMTTAIMLFAPSIYLSIETLNGGR